MKLKKRKIKDETEYLLSNSTNKKILLEALKSVQNGNLIKIEIEKSFKQK